MTISEHKESASPNLSKTLSLYATNSIEDQMVRAIESTITDCMQAGQPTHGKGFMDGLNRRCNGHLRNWIGALAQEPRNTNTHPWVQLEESEPASQELVTRKRTECTYTCMY